MKVWIVEYEGFETTVWDSYKKAKDFMEKTAAHCGWEYDGYDQEDPEGYSMFYYKYNSLSAIQIYISCHTVG